MDHCKVEYANRISSLVGPSYMGAIVINNQGITLTNSTIINNNVMIIPIIQPVARQTISASIYQK